MSRTINLTCKYFGAFVLLALINLSEGYSSVTFLNYSPSAIINGMGGSALAVNTDKSFSFTQNPVFVADNIEQNWINLGITPSARQFSLFDYRGIAINGGYNFKKNDGDLPLSIGIGYSNLLLDMGTFTRTGENGQVIGKYDASDYANILSFGAILDYGVKFGIGLNTKFITSDLSQIDESGSVVGFDFGLNCQVPVLNAAKLSENLELNIGINASLAIQNYGDEMIISRSSEPLPRKSSMAYAVTSDLKSDFIGIPLKVAELTWTSQFSDLMLNEDSLGFRYTPMFSNSIPIKNLFLISESDNVLVSWGAYISLFETFQVFFGGNIFEGIRNDTKGFGINLDGIFSYLHKQNNSKITEFMSKNLQIGFQYSNYDYSNNLISYRTEYSTMLVRFRNIF